MNAVQLIERARSATAIPTIYRLGSGGMNPLAPHPRSADGGCDCSGYTSWCIGRSRKTTHPLYMKINQGWINTDAMVIDAKDCTGFFRQIEYPIPGCFVIYPGHNQYRRIGHVGIVTVVQARMMMKVIHCSGSSYRRTGQAIAETEPGSFSTAPDRIFAWYEGLE